jgi:hypothetical protein
MKFVITVTPLKFTPFFYFQITAINNTNMAAVRNIDVEAVPPP